MIGQYNNGREKRMKRIKRVKMKEGSTHTSIYIYIYIYTSI
jgi:hypothetical protein